MRCGYAHIYAVLAALTLLACSPAAGENPVSKPVSKSDISAPPIPPSIPAATSPQSVDDIDFGQYSRELASFTDLRQGQSRIAAIDVVRLLFAPEEGANIIKTASSMFELDGGAVMLLSADGMADDSVRAQEFYLIFEGDKAAQKLADYGLRVKCYRGENTTNWQKEVCP